MKKNILVLFLFLLLSLGMNYPRSFNLSDTLDEGGDSLLNVWTLAWVGHKLTTGVNGFFDANFFYPEKNILALSEHLFADALLALPVLSLTGNPVLAYNFVWLLSFILSGWGTYLLVARLTDNHVAGFVAGIIFVFSPYRYSHLGHLQLLSTHWMPFVFLYLHKFFQNPTTKNVALFGLFFTLNALSCCYYAYFVAIFTVLYILAALFLSKRKLYRLPDIWAKLFMVFLFSAMLASPFLYHYVTMKREMGTTRSLQEAQFYSANLKSYSLVSRNNFIYGKMLKRVEVPWNENTLFPGIIPVLLSLFALWKPAGSVPRAGVLKGSFSAPFPSLPKVQVFYWLMFFLAFVLSLGPFLGPFYGPYFLLYKIIPGFDGMRVPARLAVMVTLALSVLAGYGLKNILDLVIRRAVKTSVCVIVSFLILLEFFSAPLPMFQIKTGNDVPVVYRWLSGLSADTVIVELPMRDVYDETSYMYYSTYHWKKLLNGYSGYFPESYLKTKALMRHFPSDEGINALKAVSTDYIILHSSLYESRHLAKIKKKIKGLGGSLREYKRFGSDYVYKLIY